MPTDNPRSFFCPRCFKPVRSYSIINREENDCAGCGLKRGLFFDDTEAQRFLQEARKVSKDLYDKLTRNADAH